MSFKLIIFCVFIAHVHSIKLNDSKELFENISKNLTSYCPYNGLNGTNHNCKNNLKDYNLNKLPVIMGVGWDPIVGQIKLPFLKSTYDKKNKIINPNNNTYLIPDGYKIKILNNNPNNETKKYHYPSEFFNNIDPNNNKIKNGIFTKSITSFDSILPFFASGEQYMTIATEYRYSYYFEAEYEHDIIPLVMEAINSLPIEYDEEIYNLFINYWGTHVIINGSAGGLALQMTSLKECFVPNGIDLDDQVLLIMLKELYEKQYQHVDFYAEFREYSSASSIEIYGGNPIIIDDYDKRAQSFYDYPVIIDMSVRPIYEFIKNEVIRNNLIRAINNYFLTGKLKLDNYNQIWFQKWSSKMTVSVFNIISTSSDGTQYVSLYTPNLNFDIGYNNDFSWDYSNYPIGVFTQYSDNFQAIYSWSNSICSRDMDGLLFASINQCPYSNNGITTYAVISEGDHIKSGCSCGSIYFQNSVSGNYNFKKRCCCKDCTPIIQGEIGTNIGYLGQFSCKCNKF